MAETPRQQWPYPDQNQKEWYDSFQDMVRAQDASVYAVREDKNAVLLGGGSIYFVAASGALSWTSPIRMQVATTGFFLTLDVTATPVTLPQSQFLYVRVPRAPQSPQDISNTSLLVGSALPSGDDWLVLAYRYGDLVYWRNGAVQADGETIENFQSGRSLDGDVVGPAISNRVRRLCSSLLTSDLPSLGTVLGAIPGSHPIAVALTRTDAWFLRTATKDLVRVGLSATWAFPLPFGVDPTCATLGSDGNFWVGCADGRLVQLDAVSGAVVAVWASGLSSCGSVLYDGTDVWTADASVAFVGRFMPSSGAPVTYPVGPNGYSSLALTAGGVLYAGGVGRLSKINRSNGGYADVPAPSLTGILQGLEILPAASKMLAFSSESQLYRYDLVSDTFDSIDVTLTAQPVAMKWDGTVVAFVSAAAVTSYSTPDGTPALDWTTVLATGAVGTGIQVEGTYFVVSESGLDQAEVFNASGVLVTTLHLAGKLGWVVPASGGSGGDLLILDSTLPPGGNIYSTWATLMAARAAIRGFVRICIQNTSPVAPAEITGSWDMTNTLVFGDCNGALDEEDNPGWAYLKFEDGAKFTDANLLEMLTIQSNSSSLVLDYTPQHYVIFGRHISFERLLTDAQGGVPLFPTTKDGIFVFDGLASFVNSDDASTVLQICDGTSFGGALFLGGVAALSGGSIRGNNHTGNYLVIEAVSTEMLCLNPEAFVNFAPGTVEILPVGSPYIGGDLGIQMGLLSPTSPVVTLQETVVALQGKSLSVSNNTDGYVLTQATVGGNKVLALAPPATAGYDQVYDPHGALLPKRNNIAFIGDGVVVKDSPDPPGITAVRLTGAGFPSQLQGDVLAGGPFTFPSTKVRRLQNMSLDSVSYVSGQEFEREPKVLTTVQGSNPYVFGMSGGEPYMLRRGAGDVGMLNSDWAYHGVVPLNTRRDGSFQALLGLNLDSAGVWVLGYASGPQLVQVTTSDLADDGRIAQVIPVGFTMSDVRGMAYDGSNIWILVNSTEFSLDSTFLIRVNLTSLAVDFFTYGYDSGVRDLRFYGGYLFCVGTSNVYVVDASSPGNPWTAIASADAGILGGLLSVGSGQYAFVWNATVLKLYLFDMGTRAWGSFESGPSFALPFAPSFGAYGTTDSILALNSNTQLVGISTPDTTPTVAWSTSVPRGYSVTDICAGLIWFFVTIPEISGIGLVSPAGVFQVEDARSYLGNLEFQTPMAACTPGPLPSQDMVKGTVIGIAAGGLAYPVTMGENPDFLNGKTPYGIGVLYEDVAPFHLVAKTKLAVGTVTVVLADFFGDAGGTLPVDTDAGAIVWASPVTPGKWTMDLPVTTGQWRMRIGYLERVFERWGQPSVSLHVCLGEAERIGG